MVKRVFVEVLGVPGPQGSKRHVGGGRMIESSKKVKPWREAVKWAAIEAKATGQFLDGPLVMRVVFFMPRPKKARRGEVSWKRPDLSKLLRSTEDALTEAGVWLDDSRVVSVYAEKVYADCPGAHIWVSEYEEMRADGKPRGGAETVQKEADPNGRLAGPG